ncbi:fibronectin-like isoform X2 [Dermacentor silvarum]|uniref:fibronectin-like isoform X1 n=1 Tax=Dermacentor silvarum TaxID=543639 RepID=UPI002101B7C2|nr:fibronectin-like isoform X1 [Dermacentor silvarum]XP_049516782.1 fibronectin-like isoform X2 [Dermacentor silvarum]
MRTTNLALLLLCFYRMSSCYEEKDFSCLHEDVLIPTTSVCNGVVDCVPPSDPSSSDDLSDESSDICATGYLLNTDISFENPDITRTSAHLYWSVLTTKSQKHSTMKLAGYFLTGKSVPHSFQNIVSGRLHSYQAHWLKPWTNYTLILRPFYTESGKPQTTYRIGKAATMNFQTLPAEPEAPDLVSVLSTRRRDVVLNVVGPSAWNSDPVGFRVRWNATSEFRGPQGELLVTLPLDWSPVENALNVTLPLPGGIDYLVSVVAVGADGSGERLEGPQQEVEVNVPLGSCEVSAYAVDSTTALISWRASDQVDMFRMTLYIDSGENDIQIHTVRKFDAMQKVTSRHSVPIANLQPWKYYVVSLEGCSAEKCSDAVNATFTTPPARIPSPTLTNVESTSPSTFEITWQFSQNDTRLYDGFRVRYCPSNADSCFLVQTKEKQLTVHGLAPQTTCQIYVEAKCKSLDGKPLLGSEATASVTTWSDLPVMYFKKEAEIKGAASPCVLSWTCTNSSVDYLQYKTTASGGWTTCNGTAECDVTVNHGQTPAFTSGYLRLTDPLPGHNSDSRFTVRGCNIHGCALEHAFSTSTANAGPASLPAATVIPKDGKTQLRWNVTGRHNFGGIEVTWHCYDNKSISYHKIISYSNLVPQIRQTSRGEPQVLHLATLTFEISCS